MTDATAWRCCWPRCDREVHSEDSPPMCMKHMIETAAYLRTHAALAGAMFGPQPDQPETRKQRPPNEVVYYVRIRNYVKIGTTSHLPSRMLNLRAELDQILAVEPGGRDLERQRHQEFAAERHGRREDFDLSERLKQHIAITRMTHGDPMLVRNSTPST